MVPDETTKKLLKVAFFLSEQQFRHAKEKKNMVKNLSAVVKVGYLDSRHVGN